MSKRNSVLSRIATEQITEDRECADGDDREPGRETIEPVRQVYGVRARGRHERHEREIDRPRQHPDDVLEERQLRRVGLDTVGERKEQDVDAQSDAERDLTDELPARDESLR